MSAKHVIGAFGLILAVLIGIGAVIDATNGDDPTVRMDGEITVSDSAACRSPKVRITPDGHPTQTLRFEVASWQAGRGCVIPFTETVPVADRYRIEVPGVGFEVVDRTLVDSVSPSGVTTLDIRLSW